jgi:cholesterol transport system auxiliary component
MTGSLPKLASLAAAVAGFAGCVSLSPAKSEPTALYALAPPFERKPAAGQGPAVAVAIPRAAAGFDGPRMVYVRREHQLQFFARSQWVEAPARMLGPLLVQALERTGRFRAVVAAPSGANTTLRLETEIVRLQQEFMSSPSQVRFTLRLQLIDAPTGRVLGTRELEAVESSPSDDPYGGVIAANRAVRRVLEEAAAYCAAHLSQAIPER